MRTQPTTPHRPACQASGTPWLLRLIGACALVGALGGCDRRPEVPTFDPPPPGTPAPKSGASQAAGHG